MKPPRRTPKLTAGLASLQQTPPNIFLNKIQKGLHPIIGVPTSITAFLGRAKFGPVNEPTTVSSFADFERRFGGLWEDGPMSYAVHQFFLNGGRTAVIVRIVHQNSSGSDDSAIQDQDIAGPGTQAAETGLYALNKIDLFNLLCIPPLTFTQDVNPSATFAPALDYCYQRRALLLIDPPSQWTNSQDITTSLASWGLSHRENAALYLPQVQYPDPLQNNAAKTFAPTGAIAGIMARTDTQRGVWKAPAGTDAVVSGASGLSRSLSNQELEQLTSAGINCLRTLPARGSVIWGARTLAGSNHQNSDYTYISTRRMILFLEESLARGTKWAVFEPNDEPLWSTIRLNVGNFLQDLFQQGAFQGTTAKEAYFVQCDRTTTTASDTQQGLFNIQVGVALLRPAEFIILRIQQRAGHAPS